VRSEEAKAQAAAPIIAAAGTEAEVLNNLRVVELLPPQFSVQIKDKVVALTGTVTPATAEELVEAVQQLPDTQLDNQLILSADVAEPDWLPAVVASLPSATATVAEPVLQIQDDSLTLQGVVSSEAAKAAVENTVREAAPALTIDNQLVVEPPAEARPEPVVSEPVVSEPVVSEPVVEATSPESAPVELRAPDLRIEISGDQVRLAGSVPDEVMREQAAEDFAAMTVENALAVAPDVASPDYLPKVLGLGPQLAQDLDRASMVLEETTLTLLGVASSDEQRDRVGAYISDALSPDLTVINRLTVKPSIPFSEDGK
jgi:hypothetical protein